MQQLIPSPSRSAFEIGPLTIHFYALCIILGIAVAVWLGGKRYQALGGNSDDVFEVAIWAVPYGIIGGRIYHVITSPAPYFGEFGNPADALRIWKGGLGIWGAISLGVLGAYLYFKTHKTSLTFAQLLDSLAPGVIIAQAIGRIGNYFNQEVFGKPTDLPWALKIDLFNRPVGFEQFTTFHPTFAYELIWCLVIAFLLIKMPGFISRLCTRAGDVFVLYILGYTSGRLWIETLRIDEANTLFGLRVNIWVSLCVLLCASLYLYRNFRRGSMRKEAQAS